MKRMSLFSISRRARTNSKKRSPNRPPNQVGNQQANLTKMFRNMTNKHTILTAQYQSLQQKLHERDQMWRQHHEADKQRIIELESTSEYLSNQYRTLENYKRGLEEQLLTYDSELRRQQQIIAQLTRNINQMRQERNNFAQFAPRYVPRSQAQGPAFTVPPFTRASSSTYRSRPNPPPFRRSQTFTAGQPQSPWQSLKTKINQTSTNLTPRQRDLRNEAWKIFNTLSPTTKQQELKAIETMFDARSIENIARTRGPLIRRYHPNTQTSAFARDDLGKLKDGSEKLKEALRG
jgi:hypothetical protein